MACPVRAHSVHFWCRYQIPGERLPALRPSGVLYMAKRGVSPWGRLRTGFLFWYCLPFPVRSGKPCGLTMGLRTEMRRYWPFCVPEKPGAFDLTLTRVERRPVERLKARSDERDRLARLTMSAPEAPRARMLFAPQDLGSGSMLLRPGGVTKDCRSCVPRRNVPAGAACGGGIDTSAPMAG